MPFFVCKTAQAYSHHSLDTNFLLKQFAEHFKLCVAIIVSFIVHNNIYNYVFWQICFDELKQVPKLVADTIVQVENIAACFFLRISPHKNVGQNIACVIDDGGFCRHFFQACFDFFGVVGFIYIFKLLAER